jgi:hypothetical protein
VASTLIAHVEYVPAARCTAFDISDGAKAMDFVRVPVPNCPRELLPEHHTFVSRIMQVCSLPAAGEERAGMTARPGTLGVADCAAGAAIAITDVVATAKRNEKNFMRVLPR